MGALDYLKDGSDPRVIAALERVCGICDRDPGWSCWHPATHEPLDRVVHLDRIHGKKRRA